MNVLSVFDGMSCGQIALNKAGIAYDNYFASEIKPHAIKVTQLNYPDTIQLGNVIDVEPAKLPIIDLFIGGSPCQDFSRANAVRSGFGGRKSKLFYEWLRLFRCLKAANKHLKFLLENVVMELSEEEAITKYLGVQPVRINSSLVSGQLRDRLYWTNIGEDAYDLFGNKKIVVNQPLDKGILLQDILENGYADRPKSKALLESDSRPLRSPEKMYHRYMNTGFTTIVFLSHDYDWKKGIRYLSQLELERLQTVPEGYTKELSRNDAACLLGDGWTVDVIAHLFQSLKKELENNISALT